jgi:hypothetical protein
LVAKLVGLVVDCFGVLDGNIIFNSFEWFGCSVGCLVGYFDLIARFDCLVVVGYFTRLFSWLFKFGYLDYSVALVAYGVGSWISQLGLRAGWRLHRSIR